MNHLSIDADVDILAVAGVLVLTCHIAWKCSHIHLNLNLAQLKFKNMNLAQFKLKDKH